MGQKGGKMDEYFDRQQMSHSGVAADWVNESLEKLAASSLSYQQMAMC